MRRIALLFLFVLVLFFLSCPASDPPITEPAPAEPTTSESATGPAPAAEPAPEPREPKKPEKPEPPPKADEPLDPDYCDPAKNKYAPTVAHWEEGEHGQLIYSAPAEFSRYATEGDRIWIIKWYCADYKEFHNAYVMIMLADWAGDNKGILLEEEFVYVPGHCDPNCP